MQDLNSLLNIVVDVRCFCLNSLLKLEEIVPGGYFHEDEYNTRQHPGDAPDYADGKRIADSRTHDQQEEHYQYGDSHP